MNGRRGFSPAGRRFCRLLTTAKFTKGANIMSHESLATWVDRGWESLTLARFLVSELAYEASSPAQAATLGERLTELSAGLNHCDQPAAARLVSGLAEAFTELGRSNLIPSDAMLDLFQTAIQEFGDLLVELDATGQATNSEPSLAMIRLQAEATHRQRLHTTDIAVAVTAPCDAESNTFVNEAAMRDVLHCGERIYQASESLLRRLQSDDATPYMAPVSRIHYLAESLRSQLFQIFGLPLSENVASDFLDQRLDHSADKQELLETSETDEANITELFPLTNDPYSMSSSSSMSPSRKSCSTISGERPTASGLHQSIIPFLNRNPQVIVVDESPFFRLLLSSAIESAGYVARVVERLPDNRAPCGELLVHEITSADIVIWSGTDSPERSTQLLQWTQTRDTDSMPTLIRLVEGPLKAESQRVESPSPIETQPTLLRRQIPELLSLIADKLGHPSQGVKQSA